MEALGALTVVLVGAGVVSAIGYVIVKILWEKL
jgi:hypothetical protein